MSQSQCISYFPVGNGDTVLLEADGHTILTDINYRTSKIDDDEAYDFAPDLREACKQSDGSYLLDIFVLTHPDQDHLGGFSELIHVGTPDDYDGDPDEGEPLILAAEIWVSPYSVDPNYKTDASKPVFKEIGRREALMDTPDGDIDGNRLCILDTESECEGNVSENIQWQLLAPTPEEADIEESDDEDNHTSSNDSSLVIQWTVTVDGGENTVLLGGDATVEVWDRIWADFKDETENLEWHVLLAPHHCSRSTMARKDPDTEEYEYSDDAIDALGQKIDDGFVVSSSKPVEDNDDDPPSWEARQKYLDILSDDQDDDPENRFLNPESHKDGDAAPVVFLLTADGPSLDVPKKAKKSQAVLGVGLSKPSTYGSK